MNKVHIESNLQTNLVDLEMNKFKQIWLQQQKWIAETKAYFDQKLQIYGLFG